MQCIPTLCSQLSTNCCPTNGKPKEWEHRHLNYLLVEETGALPTFQKNVITAPVLSFPHCKGSLRLDADVCDEQIGYIEIQYQPDDVTKRLRYWFITLSTIEQKYYTTHLEWSAVVWPMLLLSLHVKGKDSQSIETVMPLNESSTSLFRLGDSPGGDSICLNLILMKYRKLESKINQQTPYRELKHRERTRHCTARGRYNLARGVPSPIHRPHGDEQDSRSADKH